MIRSDVSRDSLIVSESQKERHSYWLSLMMRESLETSDLIIEH